MRKMEDLWDALRFVGTTNFWRMAVCWTICLLVSYFRLWIQSIFAPKPGQFYRRCLPTAIGSFNHVCIITGVSKNDRFVILLKDYNFVYFAFHVINPDQFINKCCNCRPHLGWVKLLHLPFQRKDFASFLVLLLQFC